MLDSLTLVIYGSAFAIPVLYLAVTYRHLVLSHPVQEPPPPATPPVKPQKTIMQTARTDLAPPKDDLYTAEELKKYDGSNTGLPIYVAIKGE